MDLEYEFCGKRRIGHLAIPALPGPAPGVLVLHGGGGLGAHARERADMLAQLGFVAFAPDRFGHTVQGIEPAKALTANLVADWQDLRARCLPGLDILRSRQETDTTRIAVIGFCFGGQAVLELARTGENIAVLVQRSLDTYPFAAQPEFAANPWPELAAARKQHPRLRGAPVQRHEGPAMARSDRPPPVPLDHSSLTPACPMLTFWSASSMPQ